MSFYTAFFIFSICVNYVNLIILFRLSTLKCFFLLSVTFLSTSSHFLFSLENLEHATWTIMLTNFIPFDLFLVFLKRRIKLNTSKKKVESAISIFFHCHHVIPYVSHRYDYLIKELPISQELEDILRLPNGDKPTQYLKNWRLITLLNVLHKLISGCISYRAKSALDYSYI